MSVTVRWAVGTAEPCEVYFDREDDPTRGLTYLFGVPVREEG